MQQTHQFVSTFYTGEFSICGFTQKESGFLCREASYLSGGLRSPLKMVEPYIRDGGKDLSCNVAHRIMQHIEAVR